MGADGYHPVRTLMVALDGLADRVHLEPAAERSVRCPEADGPENLAWRALDALERALGRPLPLAVRIEKAVPSRAGLGGGSSDAAAVLAGADALLGLGLGPEALERVGAEVGADVPFFVRGGVQWGEGRGDRLRPGSAPPFAALLLRPDLGLSTPAVYGAFDRLPAPPPPRDGDDAPPATFAGLAAWVRNDLWAPALALEPRLGATARALSAAGAPAVVMSGSGSCVAGLFPDAGAARAAAARLPEGGFRAVVTPSAGGVRTLP